MEEQRNNRLYNLQTLLLLVINSLMKQPFAKPFAELRFFLNRANANYQVVMMKTDEVLMKFANAIFHKSSLQSSLQLYKL